MKTIDLHVHSNCSDGTFTPAELVKHAYEKGLSAFALTDHDTVSGVEEAILAAKDYDIEVIPGIELSAAYKKKDIHILGLFIDYKNKELLSRLNEIKEERKNRNKKMAGKLHDAGISISYDELIQEFGDVILTRAHFAKYLLKKGVVSSMDDAFKKYLNSDTPYYVSREFIIPEDAIKMIKKFDGIPVLAHPLLYKLSESEIKSLVASLKENGLEGIEAIYSSNISNDEAFVRSLARMNQLKITGGSDFHGDNKPLIEIGTGKGNLVIPYELLDELKTESKKIAK